MVFANTKKEVERLDNYLNNNEINEAIELYNTHGKQKWAYWLAKKFIRNGDINSANEWYEESIKKGDQNAMFEIAEVLFHNKMTTQNHIIIFMN